MGDPSFEGGLFCIGLVEMDGIEISGGLCKVFKVRLRDCFRELGSVSDLYFMNRFSSAIRWVLTF